MCEYITIVEAYTSLSVSESESSAYATSDESPRPGVGFAGFTPNEGLGGAWGGA